MWEGNGEEKREAGVEGADDRERRQRERGREEATEARSEEMMEPV